MKALALLLAGPLAAWAFTQPKTLPAASEGSSPAAEKTCEPAEPLPEIPAGAPPNSTYMAKGKPIPDRYQRGNVGFQVEFRSADEINRICASQPSGLPVCGRTFFACVMTDGTVFMPNPCDAPGGTDDSTYAGLLCHEAAHLRGWPDIHGDVP